MFLLTDGFFSYGISSNDYLFRHGVPKSKILLFLNSFDKTKFLNENSNDSKQINNNIIFVGRLSPEKNLSSLISLFRYFKADQLDYKLIMVGDGPLKENLQKDILNYGLNRALNSKLSAILTINPFGCFATASPGFTGLWVAVFSCYLAAA